MDPIEVSTRVTTAAGAALAVRSLIGHRQVRVRKGRPASPGRSSRFPWPRMLPLLGMAFAAQVSPAKAQERVPAPPFRLAPAASPPWSGPGVVSPPPTPGPATSHVREPEPPGASGASQPPAHPALHPHAGGDPHPSSGSRLRHPTSDGSQLSSGPGPRHPGRDGALFPRAGGRPDDRCRIRCHVVVPGDTLWDLAGKVLDTDDPARIARYWPLIHRANRAVIGPDPSYLRPGEVLVLPAERERR